MKKIVFLFLFISNAAFANDGPLEEYISVASKTVKPQSHVGKSVDVLDQSIFEEYKPLMLTDAIHNVPGVYVKRINGMSGLTTIRIRGARSIDTKLLYNGLPLQDPSDPQASSNPLIGDLMGASIAKIEILKGASSSTWGSEAIGGVLNVIPQKGGKDELIIRGEFGSNETFQESIAIRREDFFIEASKLDSSGFDAHDNYDSFSSNGSVVFLLGNGLSVEGDYLLGKTKAGLNDSPVIFGGVVFPDIDDPDDRREYDLLHGGLTIRIDLTDSLVFKNKIGATDSDRRFVFLPDSEFDFYSDGTYHGNDFIVEDQITVRHNWSLSTTIGHQYERQWYELETLGEADQADAYSNDFFIEETIDIDNLHIILAGRENTHERAKSRETYDISAIWRTKISDKFSSSLHSHYGTSFRQPSLYELYGAFLTGFGRFEIGNSGLSPERGQTFDIGCDISMGDTINTGITFFQSSIRNKIDFAGFSYSNVEGTDSTNGVELFYEQYLADGLSFRTSYTFTEGDNLVDVPESLWDASLRYAKGKWVANVRTRYVSDHRILVFNLDDFTVGNINEEVRFTVDATVAYKIRPNLEVYVRAENLLSEDYNEGGYRTPGARVYGGVTWTI